MQNPPVPQHAWLRQLLGSWTYESEAVMGPGEPPMTFTGNEKVRMLGDLWVICEGEIAGEEVGHTVMTLGFDPPRGRFVGTFVGSMMTHLWIYDGSLDPSERILTLEAEGPSFTQEGQMVLYRDVIEIVDVDHRTLSSYAPGAEGQWVRFMQSRYQRVGS
jgi:hypothetical protein